MIEFKSKGIYQIAQHLPGDPKRMIYYVLYIKKISKDGIDYVYFNTGGLRRPLFINSGSVTRQQISKGVMASMQKYADSIACNIGLYKQDLINKIIKGT